MVLVPEISQPPGAPRSALERIRRSRGLSRERLAAVAGVSARTIYNIEVEGRDPRRATKRVLCLALERTLAEVFPADPADEPGRRSEQVQNGG